MAEENSFVSVSICLEAVFMLNRWSSRFEESQLDEKTHGDERLIMLCDGIFAIALTLLVLDIRLPDDPAKFQANLGDFFLKILFYFITFAILTEYWVTHRNIMHQVQRADRFFTSLTFLFLAFVSLFPVTITVLITFGSHIEADIIYVCSLAACGFSMSALWIYASWKHRLVRPDLDQRLITLRTVSTLIYPVYYLLSLLLLFIPFFVNDPPRIFFSWILIGIPSNILHRVYERRLLKSARPASSVDSDE
jgi:uncharacterized membrane protein